MARFRRLRGLKVMKKTDLIPFVLCVIIGFGLVHILTNGAYNEGSQMAL